jgi:PAS domain S-box-containing protein
MALGKTNDTGKGTTRIISWLAGIVIGVAAIASPLGYLYMSYLNMATSLAMEAEINANLTGQIIIASPDFWKYQRERLDGILSMRSRKGVNEIRRILDADDHVIAMSADELKPPVISRSFDVKDSGVVVGRIEIARSFRPVLERTGFMALLIMPLGLGAFLFLRIVPIKRLYRAEEARRQSETFLSSVIEQSPSAMTIADARGTMVGMNQACSRLFSISPEEVVGRYNILQDEIISEQGFMPLVKSVYENGETVRFEITYDTSRHTKLHLREKVCVTVDTTVFPVKDTQGKITHAVIQHKDVTEQRLAEDERQRMEERLNRAEKMEALGTLAGGVAHDLNNILGIVVGYSELLLDEPDLTGRIKSHAVNIMQGGERAAAIVQDLLTLARRGVKTGQVINLTDAVLKMQETAEFKSILSSNPRVRLKTDLKANIPNIKGSPIHLNKTTMNLAMNAIEAMPKGGTLTIASGNQYLDKPIHGYDDVLKGDYAVLSVSDTGEGIPAQDIKRIFEPFYTKKVMGRSGTGLGLAVVWGTVKDHGGYIDVQTEEGKGTTFSLYFPVTTEQIAPEGMPVPQSEYMGRGESILIVDDMQEQRELAAKMLIKLNYRVVVAASGEEAVEYLRDHQADMVVLDMIMDPGIDGLDTYRNILEINPLQKAVIVSGFSETERVTEAQRLGAGAYVRKPYVQERLGLGVRKELDRDIREKTEG